MSMSSVSGGGGIRDRSDVAAAPAAPPSPPLQGALVQHGVGLPVHHLKERSPHDVEDRYSPDIASQMSVSRSR